MRFPSLTLVAFVVACGGSSLDVGSDEQSGGTSGSAGTATGGTGGTKGSERGGTGSAAAGASNVGAQGGSRFGAEGGSFSSGGTGVAGTGGSVPNGGTSTGGTAPITSCTDAFRFEGEWRGSILDFYFEPKEDLRLTVTAVNGGAGGYVGELVWGEGAPPPRATDPDASYPPGVVLEGAGGAASSAYRERWPGFPYTVVRGAGCDGTLRVSVAATEIYEDWCALQTPIDNGARGYGCMMLTNGGGSDQSSCSVGDTSGRVIATYPLWRCAMCGFFGPSVCSCDASGCRYDGEPTHVFDFTLGGDGNVLSGPDPSCLDCTVRLERVE